MIKACYKKKNVGGLTVSDKIDKVVTNRWLGLPISHGFADSDLGGSAGRIRAADG